MTRRRSYFCAWATDQAATSQPRRALVMDVLPSARVSWRRASPARGRGVALCPASGGYQQCRALGTRPVNACARILASSSCGA